MGSEMCIRDRSRSFDALIEWALALIIAGDGAAAAGLPTPEEVANDPNVCSKQTYLGHERATCLSERVDSDSSAVMRSKVQLTSAAKPWVWDTLRQPPPGRTCHLSWNDSPSARWQQRSLAT